MLLKKQQLNPTKLIALGYCAIILIGAVLLTLPISSKNGVMTPFIDALFTAATSTCVTGLVVYDTYSHWSLFGQLIIITLIQVGGIGFMTVAISAVSLTKRKIGLSNRYVMQESIAAPHMGGIVRLTKLVVFGTLFFEISGAFLLSFKFIPELGALRGIYFSVFHSVSAFCNAGIDLMGYYSPFSSLVTVENNYLFLIVIMGLIIVGGLGFFVWSDLLEHGLKFKRYSLHTKVVLATTVFLIIFGAVLIYIFEMKGTAFQGMEQHQKVMASLFQAVSPRTAGFNSIDLTALTDSSLLLIICLMIVGGSPGSTAGGIKTTTFTILVLSIVAVVKRKKSVECFSRRIDEETFRQVCSILMMYLILVMFSTMAVCAIDGLDFMAVLFETSSAVGTVGLTLGITPELSGVSKFIVLLLMYFGRVGGISVLLAISNRVPAAYRYPQEKIAVG